MLAAWPLSSQMLCFALVFSKSAFLLMVPFCSVHFHPSLTSFCSVRTLSTRHQPFIFSHKTYHSLSYVCPHLTLYNKYSTTTVLYSLLLYHHSLQYCLYVRVIVRFQTSILYSIVFYANNCRVSSQHSYAIRLYMRVFIVFQTKVQRCTYCDFPVVN